MVNYKIKKKDIKNGRNFKVFQNLLLNIQIKPKLFIYRSEYFRLFFYFWTGRSGFWDSIPGGGWKFSPHHCVQTGSGTHAAYL